MRGAPLNPGSRSAHAASHTAMRSNLIVVSGGSGTGTSTLCKALQEALLPEAWLHFSVDTVPYCLPRSILDRANHENDWSSVDPKLASDTAYACACTLLRAGHRVLCDRVIHSEKRAQAMLGAFREFRPVLVGLTCSREEIERRTLARGDRTLAEAGSGFGKAGNQLVHDYEFETTGTPPEVLASRLARCLRTRASDDRGDA